MKNDMVDSKCQTNNPRLELYKEIISHYKNCQYRQQELSDTWSSALNRKGRLYSLDEMNQMLMPGSKVSSLMIDWNYFVDSTAADLSNPYYRKLLDIGESDFGYPRKHLTINGKDFSGGFLRSAWMAAKIIESIENSGLKNPRIMEVGGGIGFLQFLLRGYFGKRLTLFAVDLPETLLIQEWYLRNCYPDVVYSYKGSNANIRMVDNGFNFINAFTLRSQNVKFDIVVNVSSMQEMKSEVANSYISYIERNISPNGLFFFNNCYGHSSDSISEPTEYSLDPYWKVERASIVYPIEMACAQEHMFFAFRRTTVINNQKIRNYVMRLLWNGFLSGIIPRNAKAIEELTSLPSALDSLNIATERAKEISKKHSLAFSSKEISRLTRNVLFLPDNYTDINRLHKVTECNKDDPVGTIMKSFWHVQSGLIELMGQIHNNVAVFNPLEISQKIQELCAQLLNKIKPNYIKSEYFATYACSVLFSLKQYRDAVGLATLSVKGSKNIYWLMRFAYLFSEFGFYKEGRDIVNEIPNTEIKESFMLLKKAEILHKCGDGYNANLLIQHLFEKVGTQRTIEKLTLAKTSARIGQLDIVDNICLSFLKHGKQESFPLLVEILSFLVPAQNTVDADGLIDKFHNLLKSCAHTPEAKLEYGCLLLKMGRTDEGLNLVSSALKSFDKNYFELARAGRLLLDAGSHKLSRVCLEQSIKLKPDNFKHSQFIADIYLSGHLFKKALPHYKKASSLKPYFRNIRYKEAYCALPSDIINIKLFGRPEDINLICQEEQRFYHDIAPHVR